MPDPKTTNGTPDRKLHLLSVVAPMLNEEELAEAFYTRVCNALGDVPFELIVVDDGSSDGTPGILARLASNDTRLRVVRLSRPFGRQTALTAGLDHASGDAVVMIDADLQDPPEVIPELLDHWRTGTDVVYAVRNTRAGESTFKLVTAKWFYRLISKVASIELQQNAGDFRLMDQRALQALLSMRERNRYLRGMTVWVGFTQTAVPYERDARYAGETKYTLKKMIKFALDAVSSFSHVPLQVATVLGFLISTVAFALVPVILILRIVGSYLPGFGSLTIAILLLGGVQLITLGILGEYVGRIYDEVKGRPLYFVKGRRNLVDTGDAVDEIERERISTRS